MCFFQWCDEIYAAVFDENAILAGVFCFSLILLLIAGFVSYLTGSSAVYAGVTAVVGGSACLAVLTNGIAFKSAAASFSLLAIVGGMGYLVLILVLYLHARIKRRRKMRAEESRKLNFTLPDKDNTYVRARLNTVLKTPTEKDFESEKQTQETIRLSHAQKLLVKVREASLSPADRVQAEEMGMLLNAYLKKSRFSVSDLRLLNDTFSALLKLSAKYGV